MNKKQSRMTAGTPLIAVKWPIVLAWLVVSWFSALHAVGAQADHLKQGLRGVHFGNSLTDHMTGISDFAESKGYAHHLKNFSAPGVPIWMIYGKYVDGKQTFMDEESWDAISIQPFGRRHLNDDLIPATKIYRKAVDRNPLCQMYVLSQWPPKKLDRETGQLPEWDVVNHVKPGPDDDFALWFVKGSFFSYRHLADEISAHFPNHRKCLVLPALEALCILKKKIDAGQVPGLTSIWQLYEDGVHFKQMGRYLQVAIAYATYYRERPHGGTRLIGFWRGPGGVDAEFANVAWDCAWEAVTTHWEISGVREGGPKILTQILPPAYTSKRYVMALSVAGLGLQYKWTLQGGLPVGLTFDPDTGLIYGIPQESGEYALTISVDDVDPMTPPDSRTFTLFAPVPPEPKIVSKSLVDALADTDYEMELQCKNGYGALSWSIMSGALPKGIRLDPGSGILSGRTSQEGASIITVRVRDEKGGTDQRELTLRVLGKKLSGVVCEVYNQRFNAPEDYRVMSREGYKIVNSVSLEAKEQDENFGLRFLCELQVKQSGEHKFIVRADDAAYLYLNDECVIEVKKPIASKGPKGPRPRWGRSEAVPLDVGFHRLELIYWQKTENSHLSFQWSPPGSASFVKIPEDQFFQIAE